MKKTMTAILVVLVGVVFAAHDGYAFWGKKKTKEASEPLPQAQEVKTAASKVTPPAVKEVKAKQAPAAAVPSQSAHESPDVEKIRMLREQKQQQLDNTSWTATVVAMAGGGKKQEDVLTFADNHFSSELSGKQGFAPTNYTLSLKDDGSMIWETMQTAENGALVFWRGEIPVDMKAMRGVISKQSAPGQSEDFSFTCSEKTAIAQ
jgi:hypothetical protein